MKNAFSWGLLLLTAAALWVSYRQLTLSEETNALLRAERGL